MPAARPPLRKRLRRAARYPLLRAAIWLASGLPLGLALALGALFGRLVFWLARGERRRALAHLAIAFPERTEGERLALARASFQELGRCLFESCQARRLDGRLCDYVRWPAEDIAALRATLSEGRGALFVTGHIGNWELLARRIVREGFDHVVIARQSGDPRLAGLIDRFRAEGGVRSVGRGSGMGAMREILSALRRGALLGLLLDQDTRVQGIQVPFFGRLAHTPVAAEELSARTGAPIVVGFIHRDPAGGHVLRTERLAGAAEGATARLTARIEDELRRHPRDWVWMHRRWRRSSQVDDSTKKSGAG
ncbi:MAG: lysophospholipid acyltransferase family protein [Deltaproteobacteria bacterium]